MIKAIETIYNGYRFRSRLEARWAVFFDELNIKYEYEPEGFMLSDGTRYLPDFYLSDFGYYVEVKGYNDHLLSDLCKVKKFTKEAKAAVIILSNIPYDPESKGLFWFPIMFYTARSKGFVEGAHAFFMKYWERDETIFQDDYAVGMRMHFFFFNKFEDYGNKTPGEVNDFLFEFIQAKKGSKRDDDVMPIKEFNCLGDIEMALNKARQARFEHGESGVSR